MAAAMIFKEDSAVLKKVFVLVGVVRQLMHGVRFYSPEL